jgi:hypothetical protein
MGTKSGPKLTIQSGHQMLIQSIITIGFFAAAIFAARVTVPIQNGEPI